MTTNDVEARIRDCVMEMRGRGVKIVAGSFGIVRLGREAWEFYYPDKPYCCALGAVVMSRSQNTVACSEPGVEAADLLGVSCDWTASFLAGFDGRPYGLPENRRVQAAEAMGARLREDFGAVGLFDPQKPITAPSVL